MGKILNVTFSSSLTKLTEVNSSFDSGVLRICYPGQNRNGSFISKEAIVRSLNTIYNCPIVCHYDRETDSFGDHDMEIIRYDDGSMHLVNLTQPVGVIPEGANVWFENHEDDDGVTREYLYADALIWKRQEAYQKIKKDGIADQSMEIFIKDGKVIDGIYHIEDFEFTAFTLIGVTPCYESSALELFSKENFKEQMSEMMNNLKELFTMVNPLKTDDNTHPQNNSMEGGAKVLEVTKESLIAEYGIDVNTLDFSIDDMSVEELKAKFEEMKNTNGDNDFSLMSNIVEEIRRAVHSGEKIQRDWGEVPRYDFADYDSESMEVYCWDRSDWLLYGFTYSLNGDSVVIDFESKKRKKYAIVDFDGNDQESPFGQVYSMIEDKMSKLSDFESKFSEASATINELNNELNELREFKASVEKTELNDKRNEIFSMFEDLTGIEEFDALMSDCDKYDLNSLDSLKEKCYAIRGKNSVPGNFSFKPQSPKFKVDNNEQKDSEPYGGLFIKYPPKG